VGLICSNTQKVELWVARDQIQDADPPPPTGPD